MKTLKVDVKPVWFDDPLEHIEYCGRVCYNSYDKKTKISAWPFVEGLIRRGHLSVLEHVGLDPRSCSETMKARAGKRGVRWREAAEAYLNTTSNIDPYTIINELKDLYRDKSLKTFEITCDRNTTHQLVRHRNLSFCERSFRYVKVEDAEVIEAEQLSLKALDKWQNSIETAFNTYKELVADGCSLDMARSVLPGCAATRIIISGTVPCWMDFLKLRLSRKASKETMLVARKIYEYLKYDITPLLKNVEEIDKEEK